MKVRSLQFRIAMAIATVITLAACSDKPSDAWSGYVQADYVYIASPLAGTLAALHVQPGQTVTRGKPLFTLESELERAARAEADARLASASAQAADTDKGKRAPEVAINQAQLSQAKAAAELAAHDLQRKRELVARGFISKAQVDEAQSMLDQARARVAELGSVVAVATLPARDDARAAADAQVTAAKSVVQQAQWKQEQKQQSAPVDGEVADTFFRTGEFVNAGQPVLALLPPGNLKARFYVPQAQLSTLALGQAVSLGCDGCASNISARITHIATRPEYTPPVIYSNDQRSKLVFMVEAVPDNAIGTKLRPGQPLDVRVNASAAR
ncbi:MAG: HlyD family efflux transporter periplasmic adaptor subunit [Ramlibacter sp.]|nr:HlyD family efflux transporter periplasmic adaptor subunit [Ramlibacter sp.]